MIERQNEERSLYWSMCNKTIADVISRVYDGMVFDRTVARSGAPRDGNACDSGFLTTVRKDKTGYVNRNGQPVARSQQRGLV